MTELAQKVIIQLEKMDNERQDLLAIRILEMIESQQYMVDDVNIESAAYDFVDEDGTVDFEKLNATGIVVELSDLV
jgi:hypothetical protein